MASGDDYLIRAAEFLAKAECQTDPEKRSEFENLGLAFLRLAEQARRNSRVDVTYEPPLPKLDGREPKK
jgi:hypothetical protein